MFYDAGMFNGAAALLFIGIQGADQDGRVACDAGRDAVWGWLLN